MKKLLLIIFLLTLSPYFALEGGGQAFNPLFDVCWNCLFPIHIAGVNITPASKDTIKHKETLCHCKGGLIGVPVAYWQPSKLCEVTMHPYKLLAFGGIQLAKPTLKKQGYIKKKSGGFFEALYHVHFYSYPILSILDSAANFVCTNSDKKDIAIEYMSEFDPFWFDESWNHVLYPQTFIFGTPLAIAACILDCFTSTIHKPSDKFFWCAGCQGSLFPYHGFVSHVRGEIQASSLLVHRTLAKLHSLRFLWSYRKDEYCEKKPSFYPPKSAYKIQLAQPVKQTVEKCPVLGANEYIWGFLKTYPGKGEEFTYVIWTRAHCCVDPYKITKKLQSGRAL